MMLPTWSMQLRCAAIRANVCTVGPCMDSATSAYWSKWLNPTRQSSGSTIRSTGEVMSATRLRTRSRRCAGVSSSGLATWTRAIFTSFSYSVDIAVADVAVDLRSGALESLRDQVTEQHGERGDGDD